MTPEEGQAIASAIRAALTPLITSVEQIIRSSNNTVSTIQQQDVRQKNDNQTDQERDEMIKDVVANKLRF